MIEIKFSSTLLIPGEKRKPEERQRWWAASLVTFNEEKETEYDGINPIGRGLTKLDALDRLISMLEQLTVEAKNLKEEMK